MSPTITRLPYMGMHKEPVRPEHRLNSRSINFSSLHEYETERVAQWLGSTALRDPCQVLIAKVEHLSQILGCSEAEAERVLFKRLAPQHVHKIGQ